MIPVVLESGTRRVFASALDWPGWSRGGRDADEAMETLAAYTERYRAALGSLATTLKLPRRPGLSVVERIRGDATTDFGVPGMAAKAEAAPTAAKELQRLVRILRACWATFDEAARRHRTATLRTGPRGGGRDVAKMTAHVFEADRAYLSKVGGRMSKDATMSALRDAVVAALDARARGEPLGESRVAKPWGPRYAIRRAAWHALDHAWEIEDRAG